MGIRSLVGEGLAFRIFLAFDLKHFDRYSKSQNGITFFTTDFPPLEKNRAPYEQKNDEKNVARKDKEIIIIERQGTWQGLCYMQMFVRTRNVSAT